MSPSSNLHKRRLVWDFFQQFAVILLNHLGVFSYIVAAIFYSKVSKGSLPAIRSLFVSRYRTSTPTAAADLLRLQFMFTCLRCKTFSIVHVQKTSVTNLSQLLSAEEKICLSYSLLVLAPLKTAVRVLSDVCALCLWQQAQSWKNCYVVKLSHFSDGIVRAESMLSSDMPWWSRRQWAGNSYFFKNQSLREFIIFNSLFL